jgi:uncharacterized protein with NRDE domain
VCLILIAFDSHPDYSLIVAANRDEFHDRPTAVASFWADAPSVLAGRDLKAGGTWLGVDLRGRFAAVTNYRQGQREDPAERSRGRLVSDYLEAGTDPRAYIDRARRDAVLYNGFNLLAWDSCELHYFSNREGHARALSPGVYGLSNHLLDTDWPKVSRSKSTLNALLNGDAVELVRDLFALLADRSQPADHLLPSTGVGAEWERLLSSAFVTSEDYGTRSSTVVLVGRDGGVVFVERSFGPSRAGLREVRYEFRLSERRRR